MESFGGKAWVGDYFRVRVAGFGDGTDGRFARLELIGEIAIQVPRCSVVGRGDLSHSDEYVSGGHVVSPCLACFDKGYNVGGAVWCQQEMSYYVGECRIAGDIEQMGRGS